MSTRRRVAERALSSASAERPGRLPACSTATVDAGMAGARGCAPAPAVPRRFVRFRAQSPWTDAAWALLPLTCASHLSCYRDLFGKKCARSCSSDPCQALVQALGPPERTRRAAIDGLPAALAFVEGLASSKSKARRM